jgi:hypothetical protein
MENENQIEIKEEEPEQSNTKVITMIEEEIDPSYLNTSQRNVILSPDRLPSIKPIILDMNHNLNNNFKFTNTHVSNVLSIFKKLNDFAFKKFANTLNQNKQFIQFFKDMTLIYKNFSSDLMKSNNVLNTNITDTLLSVHMNSLIESNQQLIAKNFIQFSTSLVTNIISKGPFTKIKDLIDRYNNIQKEITLMIERVEEKKDKIAKKFYTKLNPILDAFKQSYDDNNRLFEIMTKHDFYLIEVEMINSISKMYYRLKLFLNNYKVSINQIREIIFEFMEVIRETFEIYINENKTIFSSNIFANFEAMENFKASITKEYLENAMTLENIINDDVNKKLFSEMLITYQSNLVTFNNYKKISNDIELENADNFDIIKIISIPSLIDKVINFMPIGIDLNQKSSLILYQTVVKRDPGVFSSWKNSNLIITIQDFLYVFDENITKKCPHKFRLSKVYLRLKEDKKFPYRFELLEAKKVLFFNTINDVVIDPVTKDRLDDIVFFIDVAKENEIK